MRAVLVGGSTLSQMTAQLLLKGGHEVVIIDNDKALLDELAHEMDCGFLHGDGSKPAILKEADPEHTDMLFCLTNNDQINILASLVGRSLGFSEVVTRIEDAELEHICIELGLTNTIIPARTIGRFLADKFEGRDALEISTLIRYEARVYSFVIHAADICPFRDLPLPDQSRVICIYRGGEYVIPGEDDTLKKGDEVLIVTHRKHLKALDERWVIR